MMQSPFNSEETTFCNVAKILKGAFDPSTQYFENDEICMSNYERLKSYEGKKLLIIGAGPTTNEVEWNGNDYDYIISCNHFFLNPKVASYDLSLASVSQETNVFSPKFQDYLNKSTTLFVFEDCVRRVPLINTFRAMYPDRTATVITRYHGKVGATARLIMISSQFNPAQIDIIGMDGYPRNAQRTIEVKHAFETGKTQKGTFDVPLFFHHYEILWELIKRKYPHITYRNLGWGHPYNISTNYTENPYEGV